MKINKPTKKQVVILLVQFAIVAVVLAIDLITKHFVFGAHEESGSTTVAIKGVLEFTAAKNTGASFGFFEGSVLALGIVSLVASVAVAVVMFMTSKLNNRLLAISLSLILGGALGNMVDRLFLGYVRDFIHLPFLKFFGVFNIADNALTIGVVLIVIYLIFFYSSDMKKLSDAKAAAEAENSAESAVNVDNSVGENEVSAETLNAENPEDKPESAPNTEQANENGGSDKND